MGVQEDVLSDMLRPFTEEIMPGEYIDDPQQLSEYGLADHQGTRLMIGPDQIDLTIGNELWNGTAESYRYVRLSGTEKPVFTLSENTLSAAFTDPSAMIYPYPLLVDISTVARCTLQSPSASWILEHRGTTYSGNGSSMPARDYTSLFSLINGLKISEFNHEATFDRNDFIASVTLQTTGVSADVRTYAWYLCHDGQAVLTVDALPTEFLFTVESLQNIIETFVEYFQ